MGDLNLPESKNVTEHLPDGPRALLDPPGVARRYKTAKASASSSLIWNSFVSFVMANTS
jgi:hypothetical protein